MLRDHHLPHTLQHISLIVDCWRLVHSSSMAVPSCWILAGTGPVLLHMPFQIIMFGESAGHARTPSSRNCVEILATWGLLWPYCNMRWWSWMKGTKTGLLVSGSLCIHNAMPIKHTWACRPCCSKPLTPFHAIYAACTTRYQFLWIAYETTW